MSRRPDLLVLGGGPAGAAFAALAASAGARVVLIEREKFPRDKVCGEFISSDGCAVLFRLGLLDELRSRGACAMDSCRVTDAYGRAAHAFLPNLPGAGNEALGLSRALLDNALIELAARRGVDVRQRVEVTVPIVSNGRVIGARVRPVGSRVFGEAAMATVVVAADGRRSSLVRALHPRLGDPTRTSPRTWFGLQRHWETPNGFAGTRRVDLCVFDGGYAGLSPVEGGRVNLCTLATVQALRACGGSPDGFLRERILRHPVAREVLDGAKPSGEWRTSGPLAFRPRAATAAGALFLGDAAGTLDPFCGEGISMALRSAELALPAALEGVASGALEPAAARRYDRAWRQAFRPVARRTRLLGWLIEHPRAASLTLSLLAGGRGALFSRVVAATRPGSRPAAS